MPRRLTGHGGRTRRGGEGWTISCACGWVAVGVFKTQALARCAQAEHLLTQQPICSTCSERKPKSAMSLHSSHLCKSCSSAKTRAWAAANPNRWERAQRASHLRCKYGLTIEQYEALLASQGGLCAICGEAPGDKRGFRPHVDHDHVTGAPRGILCGRCNKGLGSFSDDPSILQAALSYLLDHSKVRLCG